MRGYLHKMVNDPASKQGRIFDFFIQTLILLSLAAFAVETLPNNELWLQKALYNFEVFCVAVFSLEYVLRIIMAPKPLKYIFSFYGVIDLLAILPFYLSKATDLRALRVFRIFRIFRALKLIRYNKALQRIGLAARIVKEELILFFLVTLIFIYLTSAGIYYFENAAQPEVFASLVHSFWWAIVTLTTVGYGDVYPITVGGKIFTFFVLIIGVGVVTIPAGIVASALSKARDLEDEEKRSQQSQKSNN